MQISTERHKKKPKYAIKRPERQKIIKNKKQTNKMRQNIYKNTIELYCIHQLL